MLHRAPGLTLTIGRRQAFVDRGEPPGLARHSGWSCLGYRKAGGERFKDSSNPIPCAGAGPADGCHTTVTLSSTCSLIGDAYLKLPYAYWQDGWHQKLRLPGKAMLLIALSLEDDFILPEDKAKPWYGISPDFAGDGLRALRKLEVLARKTDYRRSPLTVTGWTEEFSYTLQPPFGPRGRSRQTGKPRPGGKDAPGRPGEEARGARVVKLRRPPRRRQAGQAS